ncbi:MAG TPA: hypothetical protein VF164_03015 [Trueperaceae bacterium]
MDEPVSLPRKASLAGLDGFIVGASDAKLQWEIEVPPAQLPDLIRTLGTGQPLAFVTNQGLVTVKTRDWTVWPGETSVRLRLALEDASAW